MSGSRYIRWAKSREGFRYNLGRSSIQACPPELLQARVEDLEINGPNAHGWMPLRERLAARYAVEPDNIMLAIGTSMANHLVCAALAGPGDHVLVEDPCYDPLAALPAHCGAAVEHFPRRSTDWGLDAEAVADRVRPGTTRLVILSDLHNPSGQRVESTQLARLADLADEHDFHVLVDEVYLEFLPGAPIAASRSDRLISSCSLTKAYGLDGLRAGWIVASEELISRLRAINDLYGIIMPHPTERLAARALDRIEVIGAWSREFVDANRAAALRFVASEPELSWVEPRHGSVGFVRLQGGEVDRLVGLLEERFDATAPPGRFFGASDHFRLAFGMSREDLDAGFEILRRALRELREEKSP